MVALIAAASRGKDRFRQDDFTAARTFLRESPSISRDLENKWVVPYAIELLGDICANENDPQKAVQLYGAALAQREALAMSFSIMQRTPYRLALDRLHGLVSDQTFEAEWQKRRSLDFKTSSELAMDDKCTQKR